MLLVGAAVGGTLWWLLADLSGQAGQPTLGAGSARGEVLRTALASGAGVGAAITLGLAFHRQRHQEITAAHTTHDATERRVTDLYTKAVEQLGHDKAAVRLGGLYALERLAQANPGHRQTIVNVICAYLRMPYTPPTTPDPDHQRKAALQAARHRYRAARTAAVAAPAAPSPDPADQEGERQVRLTAQRILGEHLRDDRPLKRRDKLPPSPLLWEGMRIDLTGATLIDFDWIDAHISTAEFSRAHFIGDARFLRATFGERASFKVTSFEAATFTGYADFGEATFGGGARFEGATFADTAWFGWATMWGADFRGVTFAGNAYFEEASIPGSASFEASIYTGDANYTGMGVAGEVRFANATADPSGNHVWPDEWHLQVTPEGVGRLMWAPRGENP
ncbi:pentapeptide repeat-containing protein [Nonomuraea jiangxiensis]|uniref:Pentapeptide repeat-containing protein n=1 Tax=Nonomuraea jiangxiensis TaxID=633440 RepID=A0A1G9Q5V5_9ACTN|nr:pentapeptide repeat-containing protein [Nonomuraea jiangxiensis]SDM06349.1 Pentapeptide repeat-containing protein [Nonomuraea jiangxiensis]